MGVVVGVDGSGRTHRLGAIAAEAAGNVVRIAPPCDAVTDLVARLGAARQRGELILVDDAHRLPEEALRALAAEARRGVAMVIARRPTIRHPDLAELDEVVAAQGGIERLEPLDEAGVAAVIARVTGRQPTSARVATVLAESGGLPAIAAPLAAAEPGQVPAALAGRVQRRLAVATPSLQRLVQVLAMRLELPDEVVAAVSGMEPAGLPDAVRELGEQGLLRLGEDDMIPAVAAAVVRELSPTERRRLHDDVARALLAANLDPLIAATHLRAARATGADVAEIYRAVGEGLRFSSPEDALRWFEDAAEAGAEPGSLVAGRAEAAVLLGETVDLGDAIPPAADRERIAIVSGAVEAHHGRAGRAAQNLVDAGPAGTVLAVPFLMATGDLAAATAVAAQRVAVPPALRRYADAALAIGDPAAAVPLFIEAAEAIEYARPAVVLPDTPHAHGAIVAVAAGDGATAVRLLDRALVTRVGGPAAQDRHRLLRAWVLMRVGGYGPALAEVRRPGGGAGSGRDRVLLAAIVAGLARRSGDIGQLRASWAHAEPALARQVVDLFQLEMLEELLLAAMRVGGHRRVPPVVGELQRAVEGLGRPSAWVVALGWLRLQLAAAADDPEAARAVFEELSATSPVGHRATAQTAGARCWADVLGGLVRHDEVIAAADALSAAELPWEASRLVGQAAIRTSDPATARRLLEHARDLTPVVTASGDRQSALAHRLSEREVEVARLVLAGRTHREIGAQLYLSPKTVEHHVARIRNKLGVATRAAFVAALREHFAGNSANDRADRPPNAVS